MALSFPRTVPKRIPALDGLRGFAVLVVLAVHTAAPGTNEPVLPWGWVGVDLFFVLSGFLITRILLATRESPAFFSNFYARRVLRIWPLYYALLAFVFLCERFGFLRTQASLGAWICLLTFTQNLYMGAFNWSGVPDWLEPTWSLGVEEQFYLLWPWLIRKLSIRALKLVCGAIILGSPLVRLFVAIYARQEDASTALTFCRFDSLCFGTLLAIFAVEGNFRYGSLLLRWSLPSLVVFFAIERWAPDVVHQAAAFSLLGIIFTGLVALCSTPIGAPAVRKLAAAIFTLRPLSFIGQISYGLYLVHITAFAIASSHLAGRVLHYLPLYNPHGWSQIIINWALAILVATVSWYVFESPILRLKRKFEDQPAIADAAVGARP